MLVIRLARTGRSKYPTYRIVAAESARAATGKFVAVLGHYNPHTKELVIKQDEIKTHLSHGAQPSNTVVRLLQREKVELPAWVKFKTKAPKVVESDEPTETEVKTAEAPAAAAAEAPVAKAETAPALDQADERVAEVNQEAASGAEADAEPIDRTETAATDEALAERKPAADK